MKYEFEAPALGETVWFYWEEGPMIHLKSGTVTEVHLDVDGSGRKKVVFLRAGGYLTRRWYATEKKAKAAKPREIASKLKEKLRWAEASFKFREKELMDAKEKVSIIKKQLEEI